MQLSRDIYIYIPSLQDIPGHASDMTYSFLHISVSPVKQIQTLSLTCNKRTQRRYTSKLRNCERVLCDMFSP